MRKPIMILVLLALLGAGGLLLATGDRKPVVRPGNATRMHAADGPVRGILYAQPFALEQPAVHWWRKERASYSAGWLVVLEVDPALVQPTARAEPVLYVGHETAERFNHGWKRGRRAAPPRSDSARAAAGRARPRDGSRSSAGVAAAARRTGSRAAPRPPARAARVAARPRPACGR